MLRQIVQNDAGPVARHRKQAQSISTRGREGLFVAAWVGAAIVKFELRDQPLELDLMPFR
jgi:hypothetical protein